MTNAPRRRGRLHAALLVLAVLGTLFAATPSKAAAPFCNIDLTTAPNCYVAVDDGTVIAMNVYVPDKCNPAKAAFVATCPSILEMAGYENGSAEETPNDYTTLGELVGPGAPLAEGSGQLTRLFQKDYAIIHASVRGTGCSAGEFDLFSLRSALDGKQIIDDWIAKQPWSNGDVGITGHSYSGLTGTMVAEQQPLHLRVITVSGLIDDLYRGITYIGGVSNMGFPPLWTLGVRQAYDFLGGMGQGLARPIYRNVKNPYSRTFDTRAQVTQCAANVSTRNRTTINDPVVQGGLTDTDGTWWQIRSLITFIDRVNVPTWMAGAYQDEQTGPRGFTHLWESVNPALPKRLIITNGSHGTNQADVVMKERLRWTDQFMRGVPDGDMQDLHSVRVYQEFRNGAPGSVISDTQFPLTNTVWTKYFMNADGSLTANTPGASGSQTYLSGSGRQSWFWETGPSAGAPITTADGPDELTFRSAPVSSPLTIAGPITASLNLSTTGPDTELFVQLIDEDTLNGTRLYLQRGMLKASHNAIDLAKSDCVDPAAGNARVACDAPGALLYRPWRPHTNPTLLTPGSTNTYTIEIFPVGHVFRPGHRILVKVMAPPRTDSYYAYVQRSAPGVNTLFSPSSITLPVIPDAPVGAAPGQCTLENVRCITNPNG